MSKDDILDKISELLIRADQKSEELLLGDFKQYYDEEFSPDMWELLYQQEQKKW